MTTNRGLIAVNRWAFGELEEPNGDQTMAELLADREPTPAEDHTRRLCAGCHLGSRKANRDDAITVDGSGCSSCHLEAQDGHPAIAPIPSNERCLGCHSRSARLSLAYEGLAEMKAGEEACEAPVTLHDGRPGCSLEADLHHEAGLECVDCHLHTELMGSGEAHQHKEQALEVSCESCHAINPRSALFTDGAFHNTGTGYLRVQRGLRPPKVQVAPGVFVVPSVDVETETFTDDGRAEVSSNIEDQWRYRTPSLRNVALTAPYMHDGSIPTLEAVVNFYVKGGGGDARQDPRIRPLALTQAQQTALVAFLESLTADNVDALVADARSARIGDTLRHDYRPRNPPPES